MYKVIKISTSQYYFNRHAELQDYLPNGIVFPNVRI